MMRLLLGLLFSIALTSTGYSQIQRGSTYYGSNFNAMAGVEVCMPHPNHLAIGERRGGSNQGGQAVVLRWDGNDWVQRGQALNATGWDNFGSAIDMPDTNTIAVGGPWNDDVELNSGHVKVFHWVNGDWTQKGQVLHGQIAYARFGTAVSMPDPNTLVVGAHEAHPTVDDAGIVVVYRWNGSQWVQKGDTLTNAAHDSWYGYRVSMPDSNTLACGSPYFSSISTPGYVHVYQWNGSVWQPKGLPLEGDAVDDRFGSAIQMLDSNTMAIGAVQLNDGAGYVKVYEWVNNSWTQVGNTLSGSFVGDRFGNAVSMSDPRHLAVGARDALVGGEPVGYARLYKRMGNTWQQVGDDILGDSSGTWPGYDVHLGDSTTLAVGSPKFSLMNQEEGQVKVYSICHSNQLSYDTIQASFCTSYTSPSGKYVWTATGTYYDTLLKVNGCDSLFTLHLNKLEVDTSVTNQWPTLTANASQASYQWLDCDDNYAPIIGMTNAAFSADDSGHYAVAVTQNGCTDTSSCYRNNALGVHQLKKPDQPLVYPNPTDGLLNIDLGRSYNQSDVSVRISIGQEVDRKSFEASQLLQLDMPEAAGLYLIEARFGGQRAIFRVLME